MNSFLSKLESQFNNQRVTCQETKPLIPKFKDMGQSLISEVRSMTCQWSKLNFADIFLSKRARDAIEISERPLLDAEYNATHSGSLFIILEVII